MSEILTDSHESLAELIHDLRQPLGTIENSAFYLRMLLNATDGPVLEQLRLIEEQVDRAARLLADAAARIPRSAAQCAAAGESLDLTKSQTAVVT